MLSTTSGSAQRWQSAGAGPFAGGPPVYRRLPSTLNCKKSENKKLTHSLAYPYLSPMEISQSTYVCLAPRR